MHILIISTGYPTDFVPLDGIFYRDQAEALALAGNKVGFIAVTPISIISVLQYKKFNLGLSLFNEKGVETYLYKYINIPKCPTCCVKKAEKKGADIFEEYVKKHGLPEIIHLHCYEAILLAMYIKKKYRVPFVITEHSSRFMNDMVPDSMKKYAMMAFTESGCNISVSEKFAEVLEFGYGHKFHYVPNIVDTNFYKPAGTLGEKKEFIFLSAGILNDNKNHDLLLRSFKLLISSGRKAKLVIAGNGPAAAKLNSVVKELMIEEQVTFSGWISRGKLSQMMNGASVFVLTSKKETFGVVLIEAMSCGIPIISTKSGGPESIIRSKKTGILCEHDEQTLFLAMQEVYDKFAAYDSAVIRQEALENYSHKAVSKQLVSIYNKVLKKND